LWRKTKKTGDSRKTRAEITRVGRKRKKKKRSTRMLGEIKSAEPYRETHQIHEGTEKSIDWGLKVWEKEGANIKGQSQSAVKGNS